MSSYCDKDIGAAESQGCAPTVPSGYWIYIPTYNFYLINRQSMLVNIIEVN